MEIALLDPHSMFRHLQATLPMAIPIGKASLEDEELILRALGHLPVDLRPQDQENVDLRVIDGGYLIVRPLPNGNTEVLVFRDDPDRVMHVRLVTPEARTVAAVYANGAKDPLFG